jgi:hypothetical protein
MELGGREQRTRGADENRVRLNNVRHRGQGVCVWRCDVPLKQSQRPETLMASALCGHGHTAIIYMCILSFSCPQSASRPTTAQVTGQVKRSHRAGMPGTRHNGTNGTRSLSMRLWLSR